MNKLAVDIGATFLSGTTGNLSDPSNISKFVSGIIATAISVAGVVLLFLLIGGGIAMISGAGKSDPKTVDQGKKASTSALIGFIVVFSAYWIVKLIEVITGIKLISN